MMISFTLVVLAINLSFLFLLPFPEAPKQGLCRKFELAANYLPESSPAQTNKILAEKCVFSPPRSNNVANLAKILK